MIKKIIKKILKKVLFKISFVGKKDCLLIGTPTHGNIGDSEITYAEIEFLKENNISFFEITVNEYMDFKKEIINKKNCFKMILLHGGGNIGNQYIHEENIRRDIIKNFKDKKIIIFPQTIYFSDTPNGHEELNVSSEIYNSHPDLTVVAREKYSFDFAKKYFNKVIFTPDIVLYLRKVNKTNKTNNVLFLLRNDDEKNIDNVKIKELLEKLKSNNIEYTISDMMYKKSIYKQFRKHILDKKNRQVKKYDTIITDRLHGMVFAYLNSKKCIALSNYNYKVKGTYEWIKNDHNIVYMNSIHNLTIDSILNLMSKEYDDKNYVKKDEFLSLLNEIKEELK